jgi:hydroxyacylglutathione hydrolase
MIDVSPVRAFADNYIWLMRAPGDPAAAVVVDPGDAGPVQDALDGLGLQLHSVLVTHHHPDHVAGIQSLVDRYGARVYGPAREQIPCETVALDDGDVVSLDDLGLEFSVMAVPGHTLGHIAYYGHGALFCGDTLFSGGCGRLFEGTPEQMLGSLDRIAALPDSTEIYCAHEYTLGNLRFAAAVEPENEAVGAMLVEITELRRKDVTTVPSRLGRERMINPFLRCREPGVRAAAERHAGQSLPAPEQVFAVIRTWKDGYR